VRAKTEMALSANRNRIGKEAGEEFGERRALCLSSHLPSPAVMKGREESQSRVKTGARVKGKRGGGARATKLARNR